MKPGPNIRRPRSRGSNGKRFISKNQSFESNGPDIKVRGTVQQVLEKYLALARDASLSGDRVAAEGYFQHAEHYFRQLSNDPQNGNGQPRMNTPAHDMTLDATDEEMDEGGQPDSNRDQDQDQDTSTPA